MTALIDLRCPQCGGSVAAADVELASRLGKCRQCDSVFALDHQLAAHRERALTVRDMQDGPRPPSGLSLSRRDGYLSIGRPWHRGRPLVYYLGSLVMGGVAGYGTVRAALDGVFSVSLVAGIALFGLGAIAAYLPVLNSTVTQLGPKLLKVMQRPLPLQPSKSVHRGAILQVYVHERQRARVVSGGAAQLVEPCPIFDVVALLTGERHKVLLSGLNDPGQAIFIQDELRRALGLPRVHVVGSYQAPPHLLQPGLPTEKRGEVSLPDAVRVQSLEGALSDE